MEKQFNISIKARIYLSFGLMVLLFALSGVVTTVTLYNNQKQSRYLTNTVDPSLSYLTDLEKMFVESKMYSTNWVFLRSKEEDKDRLRVLHTRSYGQLKKRLLHYSSNWKYPNLKDSLINVLNDFEEILAVEKKIMRSLSTFSSYDDPVVKLEAERILEEEVLPRSAILINNLARISDRISEAREIEQSKVDDSSKKLKSFLVFLALAVIIVGSFLSLYLTDAIIGPIKKIRQIVNDLGRGITRQLYHPGEDNEIGQMIVSVNNLSQKLELTASFASEVGSRNFNMPFTPLSDDDTLGRSLIAMRDNLRDNAASLELQNRELERQNRELEQFAYVASHDLQEPLRTTLSFVDLLNSQYKETLDERAQKYLDYIQKSTNRMNVLIADLLEYSRIGADKQMQEVSCNEVVSEVICDLNSSIIESGVQIAKGSLPHVQGYRTEIKQLFQNLIFNGIKFRKLEGTPCVTISCENHGTHFQFKVSDNGIGIPKQHFDRIFIIFQRLHTRSQYDGSGIGLSHCKKIVELHEGRIWLESEVDFGTTFYFTLPNKNKHLNEKQIELCAGHR